MEELVRFLNEIHPLSQGLSSHLRSVLQSKELKKKEFLLKAGQISRHVCFVSKGLLRCYYKQGDVEVSRWFMKEGDVVFSIQSFYNQVPSNENIQALEPCMLYFISYDELDYIYHTFPEFNYIGRVLTIKYHTLWDEQLYSTLMRSSIERYNWLQKNHPELTLRVPQKFLASYLGITPETLSKIRSQF